LAFGSWFHSRPALAPARLGLPDALRALGLAEFSSQVLGLLRGSVGPSRGGADLRRDRRSASPSFLHYGSRLPIVICPRQGRV